MASDGILVKLTGTKPVTPHDVWPDTIYFASDCTFYKVSLAQE